MLGQVNVPNSLYQSMKGDEQEGSRSTEKVVNHNDTSNEVKSSGEMTSDTAKRLNKKEQTEVKNTEISELEIECGNERCCECGKCSKERMREDLDICVCNPITDKYTTYEIQIQTVNPAFNLNCSHTRRRYNDFCWLRKILKNHHPMCVCPELPAKKTFSDRFEPQCIVERMKSLEDWIFSLLEVDLFFSDTTVHLFLQTNLTCSQMEGYVNGRLSSAIVRKAYKACKLKYGHSLMSTLSKEPPDRSNSTGIESEPIDVSLSTRLKSHGSKNTQRSDNGLPSSDISSDNDSSYESQNGYSSSSSDTACIVNFPKEMDIQTSHQSLDVDQSLLCESSLCDSFKSTSLTSNPIEKSSPSEYNITTPVKNYQVIKPTPKSSLSHVRQVELDVKFSINSE